MPDYRSRTSTHGRNMAGARALWRATGMKDGDFGKPIIAVVNSFTQFVPGHVHLKDLGQLVAREIEAAGGVALRAGAVPPADLSALAAREVPGAPHEALLVVDATTGQNGISQAREFTRSVPVTGVVLTKLDGTAKGGIVLAIVRELGIPVLRVGVGEGVDDLQVFDADAFARALVAGD